jgi:hypothetical protein
MRPSQVLESNRAAIRDIAARHRVRSVRVFGSVVRGTDTDRSDLDFLVELQNDPSTGDRSLG